MKAVIRIWDENESYIDTGESVSFSPVVMASLLRTLADEISPPKKPEFIHRHGGTSIMPVNKD